MKKYLLFLFEYFDEPRFSKTNSKIFNRFYGTTESSASKFLRTDTQDLQPALQPNHLNSVMNPKINSYESPGIRIL